MTECSPLEGIGTQTDAICDGEGDEIAFYRLRDADGPQDPKVKNTEVQTELDVKKIYEQTEINKRNNVRSLRSLQRKFLAIRRSCQKKAREMKHYDMNRGEYLAKLQLQLPALQQEKSGLIAERALIERQFADEKKKNRDLINRMTKLNQQFYRLGQGYSSSANSTMWRQQSKVNNSNFCRSPSDAQQYTHQYAVASSQQGMKMSTHQPVVPNSQSNATGHHGKQMVTLPQQQPNKIAPTPQQHHSVMQQPRLPIFQLLHSSLLSGAATNVMPNAPGYPLQCKQQLSSPTKVSSSSHHQLPKTSCQQADHNLDCSLKKSSSEAVKNA